jgi:hypothetical protein
MKTRYLLLFVGLFLSSIQPSSGQNTFPFRVELTPVSLTGLPGLHSYAFGQHDGKWLIIGGRKDGVHGLTPNTSFPASHNNTDIFVIDINAQQFWSASVNSLPTSISDQLQSTNMNFHQDGDTLYIIGGYSMAASTAQYITFPNLTTVTVSATIDAIINSTPLSPHFKQITHNNFAITGGQLGKIGNTFLLVGGHRFDGRYNHMGNPSYTQTYSTEIRKFSVDNSGSTLSFSDYTTISDPVHLRRRDYNLLPQIFPDGSPGYTISSGVFQAGADLPFLYPVDITLNGHNPITSFNQYLSHYHSAKACLYDSVANAMHNLFFGGISQYSYQNGILIQDLQVPFVNTISLLTRDGNGFLQEHLLDTTQFSGLQGSSAEFIPNELLPTGHSEIIKLSEIQNDTILIGHIYGGIYSPTPNPFSNNQTATTYADTTIYAVRLIRNPPQSISTIDGQNPYSFRIFPNPATDRFAIEFALDRDMAVEYVISNHIGQVVEQNRITDAKQGNNLHEIRLNEKTAGQSLFITVIFDHKFFTTGQVVIRK